MTLNVKKGSECKKCDICEMSTDIDEDVVSFGDWMQRGDITLHYFCLLLSTNLPQRGQDTNGILGFLVRDIRLEIRDAKSRKCSYCGKMNASISCYKCKKYFHLVCGHCFDCSFRFFGDFRSYCDQCVPLDKCQKNWQLKPPPDDERCQICTEPMGKYNPITWVYGRCCGIGFAHRFCVRRYALAAGYYLICLWCRSKKFRDQIRLQGVFVPDRDARWERERNAFAELHRGHTSCNMEICNCPKGRDYVRGYWSIIVCSLCGSFGAHNPGCIPRYRRNEQKKVETFICETCRHTTESVVNRTASQGEVSSAHRMPSRDFVVDYCLQMNKLPMTTEQPNRLPPLNEIPQFSEDESSSFSSSVTTVRERRSNSMMELKNHPVSSDENMLVDDESPNVTLISLEEIFEELEVEQNQLQTNCTAQAEHAISVNSTQELNTNNDKTAFDPSTSAQQIYIVEDWPEFDDELNVLSTSKIRIDLNSPRFQGKSIDDICSFEGMSLITDADKFERTSGPGIFKKVDEIIAQISESFENNINAVEILEKIKEDFRAPNISCTDNESETRVQKNETVVEQLIDSYQAALTIAVKDQFKRSQEQTEVQPQKVSSVLGTQDFSTTCEENTLESSAGEQQIYILEDWPEFDDQFNVLSTCKVRIDLNSPRFHGKTLDDICSFDGMSLITDADKIEHTSGPGVWKQIDEIIAEALLLFENESSNGEVLDKPLENCNDLNIPP